MNRPVLHRQAQAGFTMLELLVVLVIIGVMYSMVTLSTSTASRERVMQEEVYRLQALMKLLHEEAIIQSKEMAMEVEKDRYRFLVMQEGKWLPLASDMVFRERQLPEPLQLVLLEADEDVSKLMDEQEEAPLRIYILSSGEQSPFELEMRLGENPQPVYRLTGNWNGELTVKLQDQES